MQEVLLRIAESLTQHEVRPDDESNIVTLVQDYLLQNCPRKADPQSLLSADTIPEVLKRPVPQCNACTSPPPRIQSPTSNPLPLRPAAAPEQPRARSAERQPLGSLGFGAPRSAANPNSVPGSSIVHARVPAGANAVEYALRPAPPSKKKVRSPKAGSGSVVERLSCPDSFTGTQSRNRQLEPNRDPYTYLYRLEQDTRHQIPLGQMWGEATVPTTGSLKRAQAPGIPEEHQVQRSRRPGTDEDVGVFDRLSDHNRYTGIHARRFTSDGKGRGLEDREALLSLSGSGGLYGHLKLRPGMSTGTEFKMSRKTTYVERNQNHVL